MPEAALDECRSGLSYVDCAAGKDASDSNDRNRKRLKRRGCSGERAGAAKSFGDQCDLHYLRQQGGRTKRVRWTKQQIWINCGGDANRELKERLCENYQLP
jgi:hypothetical protein